MYLYTYRKYIAILQYVIINYTDFQRSPVARNNASYSEHRLHDNCSDPVNLDLLINLSGI